MERRMTVHQDGNPIYDIVMSDSFGSLATEVAKLAVDGRRICIVSDSTVAGLYLEEVRERLAGCCKEVVTFVFPAGDPMMDKNLVSDVLSWLDKYPGAKKTYVNALKQYVDGIYIRDAADNLRKALETFLQEFLQNDKNVVVKLFCNTCG